MSRATWESFRYLAVSKRDREWGLYVTGAGRVVDQTFDYDFKAHPPPYYFTWDTGGKLPYYAMLYITRGQGEFESETAGHQTVLPGSLLLVSPDVWHRYRPDKNKPWTEYWITFGGELSRQWSRRSFLFKERSILAIGLDTAILQSFRSVFNRIRLSPPGLQQLIAANVMEILGVALAVPHEQPKGKRLVEQAKLIIETHNEEIIDMQEVAASLGISYDHFRHVFKEQTGMAPYEYHLQLRLNQAKELLRETSLSVAKIGAALGFVDASYFSNIFKRKVVRRPGEWRSSTRQ